MRAAFSFAIAFALSAYIIPQQCAEHEILFWGKLVEGARNHQFYGIHAFFLSEKEVHAVVAHWLDNVVYVLMLQSFYCKVFIFLVESEEYHLPNALFIFIYMVHEYFHVNRHYFSRLLHLLVFLKWFACLHTIFQGMFSFTISVYFSGSHPHGHSPTLLLESPQETSPAGAYS